MKSKSLTFLLSLLFGSTGAQRFYLGQNNRGWIYLLVFYFILPAAIWTIKYFNVVYNWYPFFQTWIVLIFIIHLVECIYFISLSKEKFAQQDISKGSTWLLTIFSIIIAIVFSYGINYLFDINNEINIDAAKAEFTMTSLQYSEDLLNDEKTFTSKYANKVLQIEGRITSLGYDFTEENFITLEAVANTSSDVNCYFNKAHQKQLQDLKKGDKVILKGVCDVRKLVNCTIVEYTE
ncbi:MAG: NINE protein [Fimbriimonadaceae bacterium]|nr:NINE protein [Chitinophagales bacterium]